MHIKEGLVPALVTGMLVTLTAWSAPLGIVVPAYFPPGGYWNELNFAAARVPLIVIMNPNSGPGTSKKSDYVQALSRLHQAGGKVVGYVHTSYGDRPLAEVEKEIDRYLQFYAMDGFFVDEMTNDQDIKHIDYYADLYHYVKARGTNYTVTGNPGSNTQESYLQRPTDDSYMIFEDNGTNYTEFRPAGWTAGYSPRQFMHLPYGVTNLTTMSNDVALAVSRRAGWVYVTDDALPNPYNTLPSYWTNEVNLIQSFNRNRPPLAPADAAAPAPLTAKKD